MIKDFEFEEIEIVNMEELDAIYGDVDPYTPQGAELCRAWAKETGTTIYERPAETFSMEEAYRIALRDGNKRLIVDNLS